MNAKMNNLEWNEFNTKIPALNTFPVNKAKYEMDKIISFREHIENMAIFFESQKEFEETAALLSRVIAKRKNSFRKMIGFKILGKLNATLCRLLRVNIQDLLRNFLSTLPEYVLQKNNYLPSQNVLDHILTRFIAVYKIFERICDCCITSAQFFCKQLSNCFFTEINVVLLTILAKLWTIGLDIGNKTAAYYKILVEHREYFPESKNPNGFTFPKLLTGLPSACEFEKIKIKPTISMECKNVENSIILCDTDIGTKINRESLKTVNGIDDIETKIVKTLPKLLNNQTKLKAKLKTKNATISRNSNNIKKNSTTIKFTFNK